VLGFGGHYSAAWSFFWSARRPSRGYDRRMSGPLETASAESAGQRRKSRTRDLVAVSLLKDWTCVGCGAESGDLLVMRNGGPNCLACADMDHLVFLGSGDAALTRRARKHSALSAVVVRFSRARKRYERQGVLVEQEALEQAEAECLADEDLRARRREREQQRRAGEDVAFQRKLAAEILRLFPGCPRKRAQEIAVHTGRRGSGRVGRTAAGRALDREAVTLAVVAAVRHADTPYDELLMSGVDRDEARWRIEIDVVEILERWRAPSA
jgi:hypothetical protein